LSKPAGKAGMGLRLATFATCLNRPYYLSVRLDDPSLTQPLNCALVEQGEGKGFIRSAFLSNRTNGEYALD
jgi:hypothetical protein